MNRAAAKKFVRAYAANVLGADQGPAGTKNDPDAGINYSPPDRERINEEWKNLRTQLSKRGSVVTKNKG